MTRNGHAMTHQYMPDVIQRMLVRHALKKDKSQEGLKAVYDLGIVNYIYERTCKRCGKIYYTRGYTSQYCTQECWWQDYLARLRAERELHRHKTCLQCKKEFIATRKDSVYCSVACKQKAYRHRSKAI